MKKCILIYDDELEILFLCKAIFENDNYRVKTMAQCEHILSDIDRIKPDIILMDLWIPDIGGEKATQLVKNNPSTQHIPVILFSAHNELEKICERIKADGYLAKPFDVDAIREIVESHLP